MFEFSNAVEGLMLLFTWQVMAAITVGFLLGFLVGAVPGFNDSNLMAIMLPLTIYLDPMIAIVGMSSLYFAAQAAGAIPAILINIPGTGGAAATTIEGYPMAQKGQAGYALGLSHGASFVGAAVGALASLMIAPALGLFALRFGPAEMFLLGVFGLTIVGALAGKDLLKAGIAILLGLLVSLVGADPSTAFERGTFGILSLSDGVSLMAIILGLFGLPELVDLVKRTSVSGQSEVSDRELNSNLHRGFFDAFKYKGALAVSSAVGLVVGIVPGAGAAISSFVSYGMAKQMSRNPQNYGKGEPEGLVAAECANNATACAAIVPLLTLGLPGSGSTTVMLAALILHGIRPGPQFFAQFQVEAFTIFWSFFVSAILIAVVGCWISRYTRRLVYVRGYILVPTVLLLLFLGAYATKFSTFDLAVVAAFGALGIAMRVLRYPIPAFLLAFILGPILEANYLRATRIGGLDIFIQSGISQFLIVLSVLSLVIPGLWLLRQRRPSLQHG
jgi:putative tricarboxylic transport membrane protein